MKTINSQNFLVELTTEDIEYLMQFCDSAGLRYREKKLEFLLAKASVYWSKLYTIKNKEDEPF